MVIYADVYLAINFIADFFLLYITGHFMKYEKKLCRISLASIVASVLALLTELFSDGFANVVLSISIPAIMLFISFGKKRKTQYLESFIILYGASFVAGGIFSALYEKGISLPKPLIFVIFFAVFIFCFIYFDIFSLKRDCETIDVTIKAQSGEKKLKLLCDSGCVAKEPISGLPVIILSPKVYDSICSPEQRENKDFAVKNKIRLIPIKTAIGSAIIEAFIPNGIICNHKGKTTKLCAAVARGNETGFAGTDGIFPSTLL